MEKWLLACWGESCYKAPSTEYFNGVTVVGRVAFGCLRLEVRQVTIVSASGKRVKNKNDKHHRKTTITTTNGIRDKPS